MKSKRSAAPPPLILITARRTFGSGFSLSASGNFPPKARSTGFMNQQPVALFTIDISPALIPSICLSLLALFPSSPPLGLFARGFSSLPLDICLFDYCAQLNIKRDLFLSFFIFLCLFNKNVIYHVRREGESPRKKASDDNSSPLSPRLFLAASLYSLCDVFLGLQSFNFRASNIKLNLLSHR